MMIYTLEDLNLREIKALRKSLDYIPITGVDAAFIAILQNKISTQIFQIEEYLQTEENDKNTLLQKAIEKDPDINKTTIKGNKKP